MIRLALLSLLFSIWLTTNASALDAATNSILPISELRDKAKVLKEYEESLLYVGKPEVPAPFTKALEGITTELNAATNRLLAERYPGIEPIGFEMRVESFRHANAFLMMVRTPKNKRENVVIVTTGMIKDVADRTKNGAEFQKAFAGILAHEFGHTFGKLNQLEGSQLVELATDQEAIKILHEAKLPTDSLLFAFSKALMTDDGDPQGVAGAVAQTHPPMDLRASAQRLGITYDALKNGEVEDTKAFPSIPLLDDHVDLYKLEPKEKLSKFRESDYPKTVSGSTIRFIESVKNPDLLDLFEQSRKEMRGLELRRDADQRKYVYEAIFSHFEKDMNAQMAAQMKDPDFKRRMSYVSRWTKVLEDSIADGQDHLTHFGGREMDEVDKKINAALRADRRLYMATFAKKLYAGLDGVAINPQNQADFLEGFKKIAAFRVGEESDHIYNQTIKPYIFSKIREPATRAEGIRIAEEFLKGAQIDSPVRRVELAKVVLAAEGYSEHPLTQTVARIQELLPMQSPLKDDLLESTLWKVGASNRAEIELVERAKSTHVQNIDGTLARYLSGFSEGLRDLPTPTRIEAIQYLTSGAKNPMPASLEKGIIDHVTSIEGKAHSADAFLSSFRAFAAGSNADEKIPVLEYLLEGGPTALAHDPRYHDIVKYDLLGYGKGSVDDKLLTAYVRSVPAAEPGPTLAYALSRKAEGKRSIKPIFEVFDTVGIKGGQLSELWKLLPPELSGELKDLKDSAKPMTMAEIDKVISDTLSPAERKKIKGLKKVLGSASIKTVVQVELEDGRTAVLLVQRPNATALIRSNLTRARRFVVEAEKVGLPFNAKGALQLLGAVEEQLKLELDFRREARLMDKFKAVFEGKLNQEMKSVLGNWKFKVPTALAGFKRYSNLLIVEEAAGSTLNRAAAGLKEAVGPSVVDGTFRGLFKYGIFNPDIHAGNVMVDAATGNGGTISIIDVGQAEEFSQGFLPKLGLGKDETFALSQMLRGVAEKDPRRIAENAFKLSGYRVPAADAGKIVARLDALMKEALDPSALGIEMMNVFADGGYPLSRKLSVGVLKGLMTVARENYVPPKVFQDYLAASVEGKILSRPLRAAYEEESGTVAQRCMGFYRTLLTHKRGLATVSP